MKKDEEKSKLFEIQVDKIKNPIKYGLKLEKKKSEDWEMFLSKNEKDQQKLKDDKLK